MENNLKSVLEKAIEIVNGDRQVNYGDPTDNHQRIAWLWTIYISERAKGEREFQISPSDVAVMMILVKIARLIETPSGSPSQFDSLADVAGYASIAWEIESGSSGDSSAELGSVRDIGKETRTESGV